MPRARPKTVTVTTPAVVAPAPATSAAALRRAADADKFRAEATAEAAALVVRADTMALTVTTDTSYEDAAAFRETLKRFERKVRAHHEPMRVKAKEMLAEVDKAIKSIILPVAPAIAALTSAMTAYLAERRRTQALAVAKAESKGAPIPVFAERPKPAGTRVQENAFQFKILDVGKLQPAYLKPPAPDTALIREAVKTAGLAADELVGPGAIRVWQEDVVI